MDQCVSVTFSTSPGGPGEDVVTPGCFPVSNSNQPSSLHSFIQSVSNHINDLFEHESGCFYEQIHSNSGKKLLLMCDRRSKCPWQPEQGSTVVPVLHSSTGTLQ